MATSTENIVSIGSADNKATEPEQCYYCEARARKLYPRKVNCTHQKVQ